MSSVARKEQSKRQTCFAPGTMRKPERLSHSLLIKDGDVVEFKFNV
jgi:hypothetical protein